MLLWLIRLIEGGPSSASRLQNLFGYTSVRCVGAATTAFLAAVLIGPAMIRLLLRLHLRQPIRGKGIQALEELQKDKHNTPTMGGILINLVIIFAALAWGRLGEITLWLAVAAVAVLGFVGFLDDYLKVSKKNVKGLAGKKKLAVQFAFGILVGIVLIRWPLNVSNSTHLALPFFKNFTPDLGLFYVLFVAVVIAGCSNAVNLTDGLDGLAIGCAIPSILAFGALSYVASRVDWCQDLYLIPVRGASDLTVFCSALLGGAIAFLWFNAHPAEVFMGDTGSLALGGALGTVAVLIKQEALLLIVGGVFVAEALSVMLQVGCYKLTHRRIFRMSPLHHHFQKMGMSESVIVIRFWIVAGILGMLGLATLKLR